MISVLLPVRDAAAHLPACLDSLLAQTLADFEIVAVDDGSTDQGRTLALLQAYAARDARVRVQAAEHQGIASALNLAASQARGRYLARMDGDDVCHPERFALQAAALDASPELDAVGCLVRYGGDPQACGGYARHVDWLNTLRNHGQMRLGVFRDAPLAHPSAMFRTSSFHRLGGYRQGPFPEDYELWLRWLEAGARLGKVAETLLTWNDPPLRLSRTDPRYGQDSFHRLKAEYLARWLARHNQHHPVVWVVGAGRVTRRRVEHLQAHGIRVQAYLDIDPRKIGNHVGGIPVMHHRDLPPAGEAFVLSYVSNPGAPELIADFLNSRGYRQGLDYLQAG
ncbi:glycosyltransferase family 2 protein [Fundidesulfovibrio soli]|uniref:glycosyltransferase n=1 Tax=Fundidesulfovibrio soli TaxID=2922716 RepID=UPI001FAEBE23|nr:glycosyltransferase family 2 protein [Fundidesulfovibrio soli]